MSTENETMPERKSGRRINGAVIAVLVLGGLVGGMLSLANDRPIAGVITPLVIMWGLAALLILGSRRSDTIALLADDVHEERHVHIHQRSALYTVNILMAVIVVATVVDVARGGDGDPYIWIAAVGGLTYLASILLLSRRS